MAGPGGVYRNGEALGAQTAGVLWSGLGIR